MSSLQLDQHIWWTTGGARNAHTDLRLCEAPRPETRQVQAVHSSGGPVPGASRADTTRVSSGGLSCTVGKNSCTKTYIISVSCYDNWFDISLFLYLRLFSLNFSIPLSHSFSHSISFSLSLSHSLFFRITGSRMQLPPFTTAPTRERFSSWHSSPLSPRTSLTLTPNSQTTCTTRCRQTSVSKKKPTCRLNGCTSFRRWTGVWWAWSRGHHNHLIGLLCVIMI